MISLNQAVIVEGKYDKIRLDSILDALIIPTNGFRIFQDVQKREWIRDLANTVGIIVLTDSDHAGLKIRNHIKSIAGEGKIINVYIPEILGKEARKQKPSQERTLGVEGMPLEILKESLARAGIGVAIDTRKTTANLTKADLVLAGLSGGDHSAAKRKQLLALLHLPQNLSSNALLEVLNSTYTDAQYQAFLQALQKEEV